MKNRIIAFFLVLSTLLYVLPKEYNVEATTSKPEVVISKNELDFYEFSKIMGENTPFNEVYLTWTKNSNGEFVRVYEDRVIGTTIAVWVGTVIVGYITSSVIDGVVVSATGKTGAEWVSYAIDSVLNRPYTPNIYLNCDIYPTYAAIHGACEATLKKIKGN